jgi:glycosyltransferase involved in cell wall biosynthesis
VRIGIVAYWFNRGQGVVARQLRSALDVLGHETFVLARPTRDTNIRPSWIDRGDVWDQPNVTAASSYEVPWSDFEAWTDASSPEIVLFDQNYQFDEIEKLRSSGIRTIGRFVWEQFSPQHVGPATEAFDAVYSLTACEHERYAALGIDSPRVRWGIHPELLAYASDFRPSSPTVTFLFPAGFLSRRKPIADVIEAFRGVEDDRIRLVLKAQVGRRRRELRRLLRGGRLIGRRDRRIEVIRKDLPTDEYLRLFSSCDVCLAPSRWEGLGLHLYEATAFGMPIVTNDTPPMNEIAEDGVNGLLVRSIPDGEARSGITAYRPDAADLRTAIERLADEGLRRELAAGARAARERLRWEDTAADLDGLLAAVAGGGRAGAAD